MPTLFRGILRIHCFGHSSRLSSLPSRRSSSTASAAFTSYFWRNDQWSPIARRRIQTPRRDVAIQAQTMAVAAAAVAPSPSLSETVLSTLALQSSSYPPSVSEVLYKPIPPLTLPRLLSIYSQLSKSRLSVLIVLTAMSSVALSPLPTTVPVLLSTALGTALCSASANALNELQEVPFDAQMARTRNRPLVRHAISPAHAMGFAIVTGVTGPALLWTCVNPTTAILGAANIALYAGAYTYLKRRSIANTWVGAVVGGIPPVMGWTACGGHILPSADYPIQLFLPFTSVSLPPALADNPLALLALFMFLYSWQFPHFNSLAFLVRESYAKAGYRMLSVISPSRNAAVALRHAILMVPLCSVLFPLSGLVGWGFALTSLVPNLICVRHAYTFWRVGGNSEKAARKLFYTCLWYLPVVMGLLMVHKNGLDWTGWLRKNESDGPNEEKEKAKEENV
ncbi:protoheme IX farnesyltransferase [Sanghuangporus baumii]|uniref:Protoheme IX farnesyltransferase, mitochondrial n=1 Tax=Sanghuangporus baumii TaxID=108892 RepID=A0A9Q5HSC3_SANBA|nr:protoheme IX farnesyltransferase [Sanghuangporus baumii]